MADGVTTTSEDTMSETDSLREAYNDTARAWLDESHELQRQRDQARSLACECVSRLAEIERLLSDGEPTAHQTIDAALAVASGAAVGVPLRVLVEWALRGRWPDNYYGPFPEGASSSILATYVQHEIEREEAAPAAEAST